jgi:hypothetical protein
VDCGRRRDGLAHPRARLDGDPTLPHRGVSVEREDRCRHLPRVRLRIFPWCAPSTPPHSPGREAWSEIRDEIEPLVERVIATWDPVLGEDIPLDPGKGDPIPSLQAS